ncbi:hypothetical protein Tco_1506460 [Tanacetum coccineum]
MIVMSTQLIHSHVMDHPEFLNALVNHQEADKDIWDRVKMLMKGTELSYLELVCIPIDNIKTWLMTFHINRERYPDSLAFIANSPTLYYPSQSPQHSGYSMYPPPQQFTPVYAAPIHHQHHHTPVHPVNPQQHLVSPPSFISSSMTPQSHAKFPQLDSGLAVPIF